MALFVIEIFDTFQKLEGYLAKARETYTRLDVAYVVDYGVMEVGDGSLVFRSELRIYGGKKQKRYKGGLL